MIFFWEIYRFIYGGIYHVLVGKRLFTVYNLQYLQKIMIQVKKHCAKYQMLSSIGIHKISSSENISAQYSCLLFKILGFLLYPDSDFTFITILQKQLAIHVNTIRCENYACSIKIILWGFEWQILLLEMDIHIAAFLLTSTSLMFLS